MNYDRTSLNVTPAPNCTTSIGVAFDGNELLTSCVTSQTITRVDPATGNNLVQLGLNSSRI